MRLLFCYLLLLGQSVYAQDENAFTGSPYLFKDWNNGIVRFTSGREMNQFKLKFDIFKNQLLLQFQGSTFAAESKVHEFVLLPKNKDSMVFRKGFPALGTSNGETFYQVVFKDRVQLLRLYSINVIEEKTLVSTGKNVKRLEEAQRWYVYENDQLLEWTEFAKKLPDAAQGQRLRSVQDYLTAVKQYNQQLP